MTESVPIYVAESATFISGTPVVVLLLLTLLAVIAGLVVAVGVLWRQNQKLASRATDVLTQISPVLEGVESVLRRSGND